MKILQKFFCVSDQRLVTSPPMRNLTTFCRIALLSLSFSASAQVIVTPNTFTSTEGGTFGVGRYPFTPSIFQLEVNPSQLGLAVGTEITGIAFRMDHGVNVPAPGAPAPISSFEITLGQAAT